MMKTQGKPLIIDIYHVPGPRNLGFDPRFLGALLVNQDIFGSMKVSDFLRVLSNS
jgi:hypothetical protein